MKKKKSEGTLFTIPVIVSMILLIIILLATLLAPVIAPYDPDKLDLKNVFAGPCAEHLLGTDKTGRDILSRLLYGGRMTLTGAFAIVGISIVIGVPVGLLAGYYGGKVDKVLMRITDVIIAFPPLLLAFIFAAAFGRGFSKAVMALGIIYVPMLSKLVRSLVLMERNKTYVEAARSIGYGTGRILFGHILPNCLPTMLVQLTLDIGTAILDLASMSFLGLGVQAPTSDWGAMLEDGRIYLTTYPLQALAPGIVIVITVVALNVFCDGVRQYMNPVERKLPSYRKLLKKGLIFQEQKGQEGEHVG
ncbi:MAG TPA: ABC transporter permease [Candidatus Onthocola gallistercoris]|uniref:ABC transporter permease n=1 Tax=Candidatus Onthocola gallistercoris TaxID=2840876 RepID=A0A9D1KY15_9FIRM|nr:ABC transporter permease [Candidatus Onthocola gallistercoris]